MVIHSFGRSEGIVAILISDVEYPKTTAHLIVSKIADEFLSKHPIASWKDLPASAKVPFPELKEYITKYQDPNNSPDSLMKIQKELDETKAEMQKVIENTLIRGEQLDNMVEKSNLLSGQSKMFYSQVQADQFVPHAWQLTNISL